MKSADTGKEVVPENTEGKQLNLDEEILLPSDQEAMGLYARAKHKLLHPGIWKPVTGDLAAAFDVAETASESRNPAVQTGDVISIDIPGPKLDAGDGHDWVKVEKLEEDFDVQADESVALTVEVCPNPEEPEKGVAHFFAEGASSTFIITRKKNKVTASYRGRNEKPNLENPGVLDKIRNALVSIGAMAGASELQWRAFLRGLLEK